MSQNKKKLGLIVLALIGFCLTGCKQNTNNPTNPSTPVEETPVDINVKVTVTLPDFQDIPDLLAFDESTNTFIASDLFEAYQWYLDGTVLPVTNGFIKLTSKLIPLSSYHANHTLMVVVTDKDDKIYSATAEFFFY